MIIKINKTYLVILLIVSLTFFLCGYFISAYMQNKALIQTNESSKNSTSNQELFLENPVVKINQVDESEQKEIKDFVYSFESFRQTKNVDKVVNVFTPPLSDEERKELDFMMGKDITTNDHKPLPRLFYTQLFNNSVAESVIKEINKSGDKITVVVDELRVSYSGLSEPPDKIGYTATIETVVFELLKTNEGYKIDKYYRQSPNKDTPLKYEGLYSI